MVPLVEYTETNLRRFAQQPITRLEPARADSSEPRPNASSMTTKRNERERTAPHSRPNW